MTKVITEDRLREWRDTNGVYRELFQSLISECQELDQLTVTKLRPMSEATNYEDVLILLIHRTDLQMGYKDGDNRYYVDNYGYDLDECQGWIPMPIYRPEQS